jgi:signal peptidase I
LLVRLLRSGRRFRPGRSGPGFVSLLPVRAGFVAGSSMVPTLRSGQPFLYRRISSPGGCRRGEVVVLRLGGQLCVKRIFALGGDSIWSFNEGVMDEAAPQLLAVGVDPRPWKRRFPSFRFHRWRVPSGNVFVVGDGVLSLDSRQLGPVPDEDVLGRVLLPGCGQHGRDRVAWTMPPRRPPCRIPKTSRPTLACRRQ